jgi:hypothetical protein
MHSLKKEVVYVDSGFDGMIKSRGSGFFYVTRILITLSVLFAILMLVVK